ncbi:MAG: membrane protein [Candidatus Hydrogenedentota bacterium]
MAEPNEIVALSTPQFLRRFALMLAISIALGFSGGLLGLEVHQRVACAVFLAIVLGTLMFWTFRLAIAFLGIAVLIFTKSLNIPHFVEASALPVILFLAGMMIVVGALRDLGFFTWVVQGIIDMPNMTGARFIAAVAFTSALLACAVDEVTSIIFTATLVFQVCDRLKLNPVPYVIICVVCTNVGSSGTMLGNPVGIFIGTRAGLTFLDFLIWAFPIMLVSLVITLGLTMFWYRRELNEFDQRLRDRINRHLSLVPKVDVPYKRGLALITVTILFIASHHFLEEVIGLDTNSILLVAPLVCAGLIMIIRRDRARHYVEHEVDWWTLLFFMMLFAIAGTLEYTQVTVLMAENFSHHFGESLLVLVPVITAVSAVGSAFVDNVIFVAAFAPVVEEMGDSIHAMPLWWALLFGACLGGNITLIGSTANIVALGMLEKHYRAHVRFLDWLKIGGLCGLATCVIASLLVLALSPWMP